MAVEWTPMDKNNSARGLFTFCQSLIINVGKAKHFPPTEAVDNKVLIVEGMPFDTTRWIPRVDEDNRLLPYPVPMPSGSAPGLWSESRPTRFQCAPKHE